MACEHVSLPDGGSAIVCGPRRPRERCRCDRTATLLCDWKLPPDQRVPGKISTTCDAPLCSQCTTSPAPEKDLCPAHTKAFADWKVRRASSAGGNA